MTVACLEIPVEHVETAVAAAVYADRLEVCRDLARDGLTPSPEMVARVQDHVAAFPDPPELAVLFQEVPPPSDRSSTGFEVFHGGESQLATLERLAAAFADAGATSIVIGFLDDRGCIDHEACRSAVTIIREAGLHTAFHRAFDFAPDSVAAIQQLSELGIRRTLSAGVHGFEVGGVALEKRLVALGESASAGRAADPFVDVVPCGGVRCDHASGYLNATGHLHASCLIESEVPGMRRFSVAEAAGLRQRIIDWTAGKAAG
jgi:copper homeostasis protein